MRVQQRLVVAGLEFIGADQEAVRVFTDPVGDGAAGETIQRGFGHLDSRRIHAPPRKPQWRGRDFCVRSGSSLNGVIILDRALDPAGHHHRAGLPTDLVLGDHLLEEMIHHDLGLEADSVLVAFDVATQFLPGRLTSNSGSPSIFLTSL